MVQYLHDHIQSYRKALSSSRISRAYGKFLSRGIGPLYGEKIRVEGKRKGLFCCFGQEVEVVGF
jgi:hypothetical protein